MKRITSHHDGHGRTERLLVLATDEPATEPPGNTSHHRYEFYALPGPLEGEIEGMEQLAGGRTAVFIGPGGGYGGQAHAPVASIQFQRGPFDAEGSTPGTLSVAVLAALIDHLEAFTRGPLQDHWTKMAVASLESAAEYLKARADDRAARGVLGSMAK